MVVILAKGRLFETSVFFLGGGEGGALWEEGFRGLADLPHIGHADHATGELLERSREDRGRHLQGLLPVCFHNQALNPQHHNLTAIRTRPQVQQAFCVDATQIKNLQGVVCEVTDCLQGIAVEKAEQADEVLSKLLHFRLLFFAGTTEGE